MNNNKDCQNRREAIAALVLGELETRAADEIKNHIDTCMNCRSVYRAMAEEEETIRSAFKAIDDRSKAIGNKLVVEYDKVSRAHDISAGQAESQEKQSAVKQPTVWRTIMKNPIAKLAAAAIIAIAIVLPVAILNYTATPAWAIEQTIEAIEGFHAIYSSGVMVDENGNEFEFEYWARPRKDGTASGDLKMEAKGGTIIVVNEQQNVTYKYDPGKNVVSVESGITFYSSPWVNGEYFRKMKEGCTEWHEEYRKDELTGRDCVFVKASDRDPGNNWSYIFQFDLETKLPIRGKVWNNSDFKGKPYVTANKVVYNPVLPEGIFDFKIPEGVQIIKR